ncbi:hypothetical protein TcCL_Unassigned01937 [Trypanosoma cruzi]|nr:hypothetical protein TcCL_Unassigned01937 [Trypanosoma cruzi]
MRNAMLRDRERGRSSVIPPATDPSTFEELERSEGDKRVCLHFLAGGRAEVGFFCCFIVTMPAATLMGGLFSRGIHCAICACLVSNVFSTAKWGVAQDRNTWMCESIVSLARNNTHAHTHTHAQFQ